MIQLEMERRFKPRYSECLTKASSAIDRAVWTDARLTGKDEWRKISGGIDYMWQERKIEQATCALVPRDPRSDYKS